MKFIIKALWVVIAMIWLGIIGSDTFGNVYRADSAVQASQLYNEASAGILRIIAITLLLNLDNNSAEKLSDQIQEQTKEMAKQSKRIADILDHLELRSESASTLNAATPDTNNKVETASSDISHELSEHLIHPSENILCPKCNAPMKIRTATKGEHQGKKFYVCSNYPNCKEILPV